jgi:glycerol dehydrogenase
MKVAFFAGLFLADRPGHVVREVYDFCESVGLPTKLADIGIRDATDEDLRIVAEAACGEGETIHHEPCPVTAGSVVAALKSADRYARSRRG